MHVAKRVANGIWFGILLGCSMLHMLALIEDVGDDMYGYNPNVIRTTMMAGLLTHYATPPQYTRATCDIRFNETALGIIAHTMCTDETPSSSSRDYSPMLECSNVYNYWKDRHYFMGGKHDGNCHVERACNDASGGGASCTYECRYTVTQVYNATVSVKANDVWYRTNTSWPSVYGSDFSGRSVLCDYILAGNTAESAGSAPTMTALHIQPRGNAMYIITRVHYLRLVLVAASIFVFGRTPLLYLLFWTIAIMDLIRYAIFTAYIIYKIRYGRRHCETNVQPQ